MHARWNRAARLLAIPALVTLVAAAPAPRTTTAVDPSASLDIAYVRQVVEDLTSIGSTDLGMRVFGTPEDLASADYVANQMTSLGLEDVALESVPGDAWVFGGASVTLSGDLALTYPAGSMGGVPGTPPEGLSGELVFVGLGTARDYAKLHAKAKGKIVIAWWDPDVVWANHVAYEAQARGAKALILATPKGGAYYQGDGALGSFDATCDPSLCVPFVTISTKAAGRIIRHLQDGASIDATVALDATNEPANGYNTYGVIPGADPDHVIVIGAHHDAWWFGAADDTSGVAMILAVAKAMMESGYQPQNTLVFTTHTGEEYGLSDAYYDWLIGAWYQVTSAHAEWQNSAVAYVNFEGHEAPYTLGVEVTRELVRFVNSQLGASSDLLADGYELSDIDSWDEAWTFGAAGVPSLTFSEVSPEYSQDLYHTQLDTIDRIDFDALAPVLEAETQLITALDQRITYPYGFARRVSGLGSSLDYQLIKAWGFEAGPVHGAFNKMSSAWDAASAARASADATCFNGRLRDAVETSLQGLTALSAWDDTIYPHEQVQNDGLSLDAAVVALRQGDWKAALGSLLNVANVWYVPLLAREWFQREMAHHDPSDPNLAWGGQGKLAPYLDLWDVYMSIRDKGRAGETDFADETHELRRTRDDEITEFGARIDALVGTMHAVTDRLEAAAAC